jgi:hypothetical protein
MGREMQMLQLRVIERFHPDLLGDVTVAPKAGYASDGEGTQGGKWLHVAEGCVTAVLGRVPLPRMSLQDVRMSSSSARCESSADSVVTPCPLSAASRRLSMLGSMKWR